MSRIFILLFALFFGSLLITACTQDSTVTTLSDQLTVKWGLEQNRFHAEPAVYDGFFVVENHMSTDLNGNWEIRFNGYFNQLDTIDARYTVQHITGEYFTLHPVDSVAILAGESDTIRYSASGSVTNLSTAPRGFFLLRNGKAATVNWEQLPMTKTATWGGFGRPSLLTYDDAAALYEQHPAVSERAVNGHQVVPAPQEISLLDDALKLAPFVERDGVNTERNMATNRLHIWTSGALWYAPSRVFKAWMASIYGVEVVNHEEGKPDFPHLELIYDTNIDKEAYEIFNMSPELTIVSASSTAGMLYGLATVVQSLNIEDGQLTLPLEKVVDQPRFAYRGQMLDVSRNFHTKESVMKLLDLMALFKLNKFHFHLTDDEGWRLEIPGLPELTEVGAKRGYTANETDHLHPAYGSGGQAGQLAGSGYYSREDFIEILKYADERDIEVIPEFDLPGHARAAIKAMEAYAQRTGDDSYLLSEVGDTSRYQSIQDYPDNTIVVCQASTYKFLEKVIAETDSMYTDAGLELTTLHTGGDEVAAGVWTGVPACHALLSELGETTTDPDQVKNILSAYFLQQFKEILDGYGIRTAGWEEVAMERKADKNGGYRYVANPEAAEDKLLPYVWNSLGDNADLAYELANAGYDVVICNVTNFYFDLAYTNDPNEPGLNWGGYVDTYKPWAFAPYDVVKTIPASWSADGPSEEELRQKTVKLEASAFDHIQGIQGQLWSETVHGNNKMDHYLWPKMLGLAERAWSAPATWETREETAIRASEMADDWSSFATRIGHFTLPLLTRYGFGEGVDYRLSPVGAKIENGKLMVKTGFPGLPVYYQTNGGAEMRYLEPVVVKAGQKITLTTGVGERRSRVVELE